VAGVGSEQAVEFPLSQTQALESLQEVLPSGLNVRGLLQKLPGPLLTIRTSHLETFNEGRTNPTVPIQASEQFLVNGHRNHIREALV